MHRIKKPLPAERIAIAEAASILGRPQHKPETPSARRCRVSDIVRNLKAAKMAGLEPVAIAPDGTIGLVPIDDKPEQTEKLELNREIVL
jgi:hypothetical protein